MNTPESDMEQMKFAREWVRKKAKKRMEKLEKKLKAEAKKYFGHSVNIAYTHSDKYFVLSVPQELNIRHSAYPFDRIMIIGGREEKKDE